jgi:diadenosine tetraphosphate (Ap4A) HIT family hydrolase
MESGAVDENTARTPPTCAVCGPLLTPILGESAHWRVALNLNQNLLGKCIIVLRRHEEQVTRLTPDEWADLQQQVQAITDGLRLAFQPDHFNYAFLQNQDRHVHLHVIPRYASPRSAAGETFTDQDYPGHYAAPGPVRRLTQEQMSALASSLQPAMARRTAS